MEARKRRRKKQQMPLNYMSIALIVCVAIVLIFGVIKLFGGSDDPTTPASTANNSSSGSTSNPSDTFVTIASDANAKDGTLPGFEAGTGIQNPEDLFSYRINTKPYFKSADGEGNILLENSAENLYLMQVDYELADTGELVWRSGYIKPGQYIENVKLNKTLENGVYEGIVFLYAIDPATLDVVDMLEQEITLYIGVKKT